MITSEKKPAMVGGSSSRNDARPGDHTELHLQAGACGQTQKKASGFDYDDLLFIRDAVDFSTVRQFAPNKYRAGRLAGLGIALYSTAGSPGHIEIIGPLSKKITKHLEAVPLTIGCGGGDDLPLLGFRDEAGGNMLYRVSGLGQLLDLAVESAAILRRKGGVV